MSENNHQAYITLHPILKWWWCWWWWCHHHSWPCTKEQTLEALGLRSGKKQSCCDHPDSPNTQAAPLGSVEQSLWCENIARMPEWKAPGCEGRGSSSPLPYLLSVARMYQRPENKMEECLLLWISTSSPRKSKDKLRSGDQGRFQNSGSNLALSPTEVLHQEQ